MNAHKVEILIIDLENIGSKNIKYLLEQANFPNDCLSCLVKSIETAAIGEWHDDHPLNKKATSEAEYARIFKRR